MHVPAVVFSSGRESCFCQKTSRFDQHRLRIKAIQETKRTDALFSVQTRITRSLASCLWSKKEERFNLYLQFGGGSRAISANSRWILKYSTQNKKRLVTFIQGQPAIT